MYHDAGRVRVFVEHLRRLRLPDDSELHVLVTDNAAQSRSTIPGAEVLPAPRNLGYLGGCVHALDTWLAREQRLPDWVCISNTDLELASDFLERLATEAWPEDAGVAAPDICLVNGARQNPLLWRRPSRVMMLAYAVLARSRLFAFAFNAGTQFRHDMRQVFRFMARPEKSTSIYAPHGSLMAIHRRFFERGAALAYGGTMYGEEIHVAEQARRAGLRVVWRQDLRAVHDQHATLRHVSRAQQHQWLAESASVLWRDYFGRES